MKRIEQWMTDSRSYITQLQLDHKSMPSSSSKKKDLKNKINEYNAKFHQLENRIQSVKAIIISDDDMEFDEDNTMDEEAEMSFMLNKLPTKKRLEKTDKIINKQNNMLQDAIKTGL